MVEVLHLLFNENEYDFVHMSNSLDHCFDPISGIKELLYITKVGGKVVLRHTNNEAEREKYSGFHQWNLTIDEGNFIVWRKNEVPLVVNDIISEFAEIEYIGQCEEKLFEDNWEYNKVVIRKKKQFNMDIEYSKQVIISLIEEITNIRMKEIESK